MCSPAADGVVLGRATAGAGRAREDQDAGRSHGAMKLFACSCRGPLPQGYCHSRFFVHVYLRVRPIPACPLVRTRPQLCGTAPCTRRECTGQSVRPVRCWTGRPAARQSTSRPSPKRRVFSPSATAAARPEPRRAPRPPRQRRRFLFERARAAFPVEAPGPTAGGGPPERGAAGLGFCAGPLPCSTADRPAPSRCDACRHTARPRAPPDRAGPRRLGRLGQLRPAARSASAAAALGRGPREPAEGVGSQAGRPGRAGPGRRRTGRMGCRAPPARPGPR